MIENIKMLQKEFERIKSMGYIKGIYNSSQSIGRTFENELNLLMNKECVPDYFGIEIKTRRAYTKSRITLFSAVPNGSTQGEMKRLLATYGYPYRRDRNYNALYAVVDAVKMSFGGRCYQYKLDVDSRERRIYLCIYDRNGNLIERKIYWSYPYLKEKLENKIKHLAIVKAWPNNIDGWNYFKYSSIEFYVLKRFNKFIDLIVDGTIKLVIRVDIYLDENNYGKMYDHGCGFQISYGDITKLFFVLDLETKKLK
jgi:hypothetical protein